MLLLAGALSIGAPGVAVPLYDDDAPCADPRYPAVAGGWLFSCDRQGRVAQALRLADGHRVTLPVPAEQPALGPGCVYVPGVGGGLWLLGDGDPVAVEKVAFVPEALAAPPVTDCAHIAILTKDSVQAFAIGDVVRKGHPAHPSGWDPPALAFPLVAWVEEPTPGERDVVALNVETGARIPLATGPGPARHVIGADGLLAWVEAEAIAVYDPADGQTRRAPAQTGFSAPPDLDQGIVCYEDRSGADLDLACTDGWRLHRPGHQQAPQRSGALVLFREEGRLMVWRP